MGQTVGTSIFEIEEESVRRFAEAAGESNPLYRDAEYARKSAYGSIIVPPGYISSLWYWGTFTAQEQAEPMRKAPGLMDVILTLSKAGYQRAIDTGMDYEFFQPIRVGDTIKAASVVKDIVERSSGDEKAVFMVTVTTYTNQRDEVVATARMTTAHH
ncbi:MaoC family dehydratase N-terminal domain-containing protein [Chloroflexota bacterium]